MGRNRATALDPIGEPVPSGYERVLEYLLDALGDEPFDEQAARMEDLHTGLRVFAREAWHVLEPPEKPLVDGWYIDAICDHLMAVTRGEIRDLIITIPPRHWKSGLATICHPCWEWGPARKPALSWLFNSYAHSLSLGHSNKRRQLIASPWYQERWGKVFRVGGQYASETAIKYQNNRGGQHLSTSVGGANIGEGGDRILADDANDVRKIHYESERASVIRWWSEVMTSRRNDPRTAARIIIMQRSHEEDLAGHVLQEGGYVHLNLPFEYDPKRKCVTPWYTDPRTVPGEILCPARFPPEEVATIKKGEGPYGFACTPPDTPITMADWTIRPIEDIRPGDTVLGFEWGQIGMGWKSARPSKVIRVYRYDAVPLVDVRLLSGRRVRCTPDHLWYHRHRGPENGKPRRPIYQPASAGRDLLLIHDVTPPSPERAMLLAYLAGIIDGEGGLKPGKGKQYRSLQISQSPTANPEVWEAIEVALLALGVSDKIFRDPPKNPRCGERGLFSIRETGKIIKEILRTVPVFGKAGQGRRILGRQLMGERDRMVSITPSGISDVYALETETGNYVAWGYASSNSQYNQSPSPLEGGIFKRAWFRTWVPAMHHLSTSAGVVLRPEIVDRLIWSWDLAFKDARDSSYVCGQLWGRVGADAYLLDQRRGRWDFVETRRQMLDSLKHMPLRHRTAPEVYVEDKANGPAIISDLRGTVPGLLAFSPHGSKEARAYATTPRVAAGNYVLPHPDLFPWVADLMAELTTFPNAAHDDQVDALTQADQVLYGMQEVSVRTMFAQINI